jgi:hypothetical protein
VGFAREGNTVVTEESAGDLRLRLRGLGLSDGAITAAWPHWWSEDAEASASARAELRFGIARRLGLDPHSLLDERDEPRFLWREEARFKHLSGESDRERAGITSFGRAIASVLINALPPSAEALSGASAGGLRESILTSGRPFVSLVDLLALSWGVAVPVVHLRVFPWQQKRMAAMTVRVGARSTVLLGKDSVYPATIAFYLAHELGHIAREHVDADRQIVDLTGDPEPKVLPTGPGSAHGRAVARAALESAEELGIEPGTLALCFGHSTGDWQTANAALSHIYTDPQPVWAFVNAIARRQLDLADLPLDAGDFLDSVLGEAAA